MKKKKQKPAVDPAFLQREKAALKRKNRQVIYLNDRELAALTEYCNRFNIKTGRSDIFRRATMEKILAALGESHPTLF